MKICCNCKEEKDVSEFHKKGNENRTSSQCKKCFNRYCMDRWTQRKKDAIEYKGSSCMDCGLVYNNNHYIFDFHHLDPSLKEKDWNQLRLTSWDKIKIELDKCDLLCGNCHRTRHWKIDNEK